MSDVKLTAPVVEVIIEQPSGELAEIRVQTDNRDAIQWDVTRGRKQWPTGGDAPMLWITFLAWHALRRSGATELSLDDFLKACVQVRHVKEDGTTAAPDELTVGPTRPVPVTG